MDSFNSLTALRMHVSAIADDPRTLRDMLHVALHAHCAKCHRFDPSEMDKIPCSFAEKEDADMGTHSKRFPINSGTLTDMTCGVNGENFIQRFRPTHFTADWRDGQLRQVRIWGPRVLDDGSLGKRELDHRWKETPARGPIRFSDLPPEIANQLRDYNAQNRLSGLP